MIKKITVENWKSFDNAVFHIDPVTILIGTNAGGKSNLLEAFLFLQRIASNVGISQAIGGDVGMPAIRGGFEWACRKPEREFTIKVLIERSAAQDYQYSLSCIVNGSRAEVHSESLDVHTKPPQDKHTKQPGTQYLFRTASEETNTSELTVDFAAAKVERTQPITLSRSHSVLSQAASLHLPQETAEGIKRVLSALQDIFVFYPIPSHMRDYKPFSDSLQADGSNIAGVLAGLEPKEKAAMEQELTHYLKDLPEKDIKRVWTEPVGKFQTDSMLYCEESWGREKHEVDARGMSDGTLRYLAIVTALLTRRENSLLIIEEIDNGLHPSRAKILVDMLRELGKKRSIDVIATTHNPALLNAAGGRMVPFITVVHRDEKTGSSMLSLLEEIDQLPKLMAGGTLGRITEQGLLEPAIIQQAIKADTV